MLKIRTKSVEETQRLGEMIARSLCGTEVVALYGDLGVGKTHITQGICKGLGVDDGVSSPTFALVNEYSGKCKIYHFDMYRVKTLNDLYSTGFFDYIDTGVIIVEWSENIEAALPKNAIKIKIERTGAEKERVITVEN